jgi:hypothetical protein
MSQQVINQLKELQPESGMRISDSVITGMTLSLSQNRYKLMKTIMPGSKYLHVPMNGTQSLMQSENIQSIRKLKTLPAEREDNFTHSLNTELLGGEQYPVLTAVLGTAAGAVSGGAGLLFTIATTGLSLSQTAQRVLARLGDELWQVEEIGKANSSGWFDGNTKSAYHIGSYFLVDPHRGTGPVQSKGWLIHEERRELTLQ